MAGGDVCSSESFNEDITVFAKQVQAFSPTVVILPSVYVCVLYTIKVVLQIVSFLEDCTIVLLFGLTYEKAELYIFDFGKCCAKSWVESVKGTDITPCPIARSRLNIPKYFPSIDSIREAFVFVQPRAG